jgi:FMN phosphatase YigB (HAD superfamily)
MPHPGELFKAILFDVGGTLLVRRPPDEAVLMERCREIGVSPCASLYVSDHLFDILCAKQAGMTVAWLCEASDALLEQNPYQPDYRIGSLAGVLAL